jgi:PPP family 3-phenylpropionic acid transporter
MSAYLFFKLSALYFVYFALLGVMAPYLSLYLESEGFSLLEIGQLVSLLMVTKVVAPLLWGSLADKYNKNILLVRLGAIMTLLCYLGFFWAHTFWSLAVVIVLYSFFWNAVLPQIEVLTLYNLAEQKNRYSRIRLWGSIGFIFSVAICGWLFDEQELTIFPWVLLVLISAIVIVSLLGFSEVKLEKTQIKFGKTFRSQLCRSWILLFFSVSFLLQVSHGAYYTYFSIYLSSLGYPKVQIGMLWALGVVAEIVMFVVMHRWLKRSSIENIMFLSLLLTVIRWVMTAAYADSLLTITLVQCLHAFSFGAMHVASIQFVHHNFEQQNQGRAQALYSSMGFGAGGAVGAYLSGYVVSAHNYSNAFLVSAVICLLGLVLVLLMKYQFKNLK